MRIWVKKNSWKFWRRSVWIKRIEPAMALSFYFAKFTIPIMEKQFSSLVERHISVEVISSNLILVLFYFYQSGKGDFKEVIRNLSLDELELILCDMYEMDEWLPNPVFDKNGFAKTSNTLWTIGEFRNYVANHIYPRTKTSIKNLEAMARSLQRKWKTLLLWINRTVLYLFAAKMVGENIQDLLYAME